MEQIKYERLAFRVTKEEKQNLNDFCEAYGLTMSELLREATNFYIKYMKNR